MLGKKEESNDSEEEIIRIRKEPILSKRNSQIEVNKLLDYYEIYPNEIGDEDLRKNVELALVDIVLWTGQGYITFDTTDKGHVEVVQNRQGAQHEGKKIKYLSKNMGNAKTEMRHAKRDDDYGKMYSLMGSLCGAGSPFIKNLDGVDHRVMEALSIVFLQCS